MWFECLVFFCVYRSLCPHMIDESEWLKEYFERTWVSGSKFVIWKYKLLVDLIIECEWVAGILNNLYDSMPEYQFSISFDKKFNHFWQFVIEFVWGMDKFVHVLIHHRKVYWCKFYSGRVWTHSNPPYNKSFVFKQSTSFLLIKFKSLELDYQCIHVGQ